MLPGVCLYTTLTSSFDRIGILLALFLYIGNMMPNVIFIFYQAVASNLFYHFSMEIIRSRGNSLRSMSRGVVPISLRLLFSISLATGILGIPK